MGKAETDRKEHQSKLATSGYRVPDSFYVDTTETSESAEKESGDGGKSAADIDSDDSEHGFKGELMSRKDFDAENLRRAASGQPATAPANKSATPGTENSDSVVYASSAAEDAAKEAGLVPADFRGKKPSGDRGFTKSDVDQIAASKK